MDAGEAKLEAFYKMLDWLTMDQAIDRLNTLTKTQIPMTDAGLMQLCAAGKCSAFINTDLPDRTDCELNHLLFEATGYHQLLNASHFVKTLGVRGYQTVKASGRLNDTETTWSGLFRVFDYGIHFKSTDIQALATQMHESSGQPCVPEALPSRIEQGSVASTHAEAVEGSALFQKLTKMAALYRQLDWLTLEQAIDWIRIISGEEVDSTFLYAMAEFKNCSMHIDGRGRQGHTNNKEDPFKLQEVFGIGYCQVTTPLTAANEDTQLSGPAMPIDGNDSDQIYLDCSWWINSSESFEPLFKPAEIEALGKMVMKGGRWSSSPQEDRHWSHALRGAAPAEETRAYIQPGDAIDTMQDSNGQPSHENENDSSIAEQKVGDTTSSAVVAHIPKMRKQEQAVLAKIRQLGHTPEGLPKRPPGKRWVKDEVWKELESRTDLFTWSAFDKTWGRLRKNLEIADQA